MKSLSSCGYVGNGPWKWKQLKAGQAANKDVRYLILQ